LLSRTERPRRKSISGAAFIDVSKKIAQKHPRAYVKPPMPFGVIFLEAY